MAPRIKQLEVDIADLHVLAHYKDEPDASLALHIYGLIQPSTDNPLQKVFRYGTTTPKHACHYYTDVSIALPLIAFVKLMEQPTAKNIAEWELVRQASDLNIDFFVDPRYEISHSREIEQHTRYFQELIQRKLTRVAKGIIRKGRDAKTQGQP